MTHSPAGRNLPLDWVGGSEGALAGFVATVCHCIMFDYLADVSPPNHHAEYENLHPVFFLGSLHGPTGQLTDGVVLS